MKRCSHCLTTNPPDTETHCPVCGIGPSTPKKQLTPEQRCIRRAARGIRMAAMAHLIGAGFGLLLIPCFPKPAALLMLALINGGLAFGLARYALLAYKCATVYYFLIGMVNVISIQHGPEHLGGILLALTALYLVGNRHAKAVFERETIEPGR